MSELKPHGEIQANPEEMTFREVLVTDRTFGDLSDVFLADGQLNPGTFNYDAIDAFQKGYLKAVPKPEGGLRYFLTGAWQKTEAKVKKASKEFVNTITKADEKEIGFDKLAEMVSACGFTEQYQIKKEKNSGLYKLYVESKDSRPVAQIILSGSLDKLRKKLEKIRSVLRLIQSQALEDRFKLLEDTDASKGPYAHFIVYIYPEARRGGFEEGVMKPEYLFKGTAASIWKQIQETFVEPKLREDK
jgi:hypothetical protein